MEKESTSASSIIAKYQSATVEEIMEQPPSIISAEQLILASKLHEATLIRIKAERIMANKWAELRVSCETDGQANNAIKQTQEYEDVQIAKNNEKTVIEVLRSMKKLMTSRIEEARNQI